MCVCVECVCTHVCVYTYMYMHYNDKTFFECVSMCVCKCTCIYMYIRIMANLLYVAGSNPEIVTPDLRHLSLQLLNSLQVRPQFFSLVGFHSQFLGREVSQLRKVLSPAQTGVAAERPHARGRPHLHVFSDQLTVCVCVCVYISQPFKEELYYVCTCITILYMYIYCTSKIIFCVVEMACAFSPKFQEVRLKCMIFTITCIYIYIYNRTRQHTRCTIINTGVTVHVAELEISYAVSSGVMESFAAVPVLVPYHPLLSELWSW